MSMISAGVFRRAPTLASHHLQSRLTGVSKHHIARLHDVIAALPSAWRAIASAPPCVAQWVCAQVLAIELEEVERAQDNKARCLRPSTATPRR
jgi:hypothetical protein